MANKFRKSRRSENKGATQKSKNSVSLETQHQNAKHFVASMPRMVGQIPSRKEVKFVDVISTSYVIDNTGTLTLLNGISEGDDFTNRNGRSVRVTGLQLRGIGVATIATGLAQLGRVILFWDNATLGALPNISDVLATSPQSSLSPYNMVNVNRFTILYDHQFVLDSNSTTFSRAEEVSVNIKLNAVTRFITTAATIGGIQSGGLFMITLGSNNSGTTAGTFTAWTRVQFQEEQ